MEINLLLTAQRLELADQLVQSQAAGGVVVIKNVRERTYLAVTPKQWKLLQLFREPSTVPRMLEQIIEQRLCPPLGEFYELILKAVRARILIEPHHAAFAVPAANWAVSLRPQKLRYAVWVLLAVGVGLTAVLQPDFPTTVRDVAASLALLGVAWVAGMALAASLLRGAGGEVYLSWRGLINAIDVCVLPPAQQRVVLFAPAALLATATGVLTWQRPEWAFFPLVGLLIQLRPVLHGNVSRMIRAGANPRLSDAEHDFLFPLNRTPAVRWKLLKASLRSATTWKEIGYGALWTIAVAYFVGVVTDIPPWTLTFWRVRGPWLAATLVGSLGVLGIVYLISEFYLFARDRAIARHETLRLFWRRWFRRGSLPTTNDARARAVLRSPLLRTLPPPEQSAIAAVLKPVHVGPWKILQAAGEQPKQISLILSGKVGVYRPHPSGRRVLLQVLHEDELVGLHGAADPRNPEFIYRTLTPVVLLQLDWADAGRLILSRVEKSTLTNLVQKLPFLARISLCQNWHIQAVQRFAELSEIKDYQANEVVLFAGIYSEKFFIVMEGETRIVKRGAEDRKMRRGSFFGEIGLLQNSNATAQVMAGESARALVIQRKDFLRFVAHNYSVAIELERVSSQRLGRPIFPLSPGDFKTH